MRTPGKSTRHSRTGHPVPPIEPLESRTLYTVAAAAAIESLNGLNNNLAHPTWGAANTDLLRKSFAAYADGISALAGADRPSARAVSNALNTQLADLENNRHLSDMVYVFGQFLDHDIDLTTTGSSPINIAVPLGDPSFDPNSTGTQIIPDTRSVTDPKTGTSRANPLQQLNTITSFIDGSQIYGSDATRAAALRTFSGGHLKTSAGNLLPFNTAGLANANDAHLVADNKLFLAGDVRANENIELTAIQTLFMREHNRIADQLHAQNPRLTDEQLYQQARKLVIAELQAITFNEFLPALLGPAAPGKYTGYNPNVNPSVSTEFSTVAFRFGHSMLDDDIDRLKNDGTDIPEGSVGLANAFFNPTLFDPTLPNGEGNIGPILKGAISGNAQEIDVHVVDSVRNFLFGPPGAGGLDLAALNIQRGRDHGIPDYNSLRAAYGLPKVTSFAQITSDPALQASLQSTYGNVNNIDPWVGGLAENHIPAGSVGPLFARIIADQFNRLRTGDRFWFENTFSGATLTALENTRLSDIIKRNTSLTNVQANVFFFGIQPPAPTQPQQPPPTNITQNPRPNQPQPRPTSVAATATAPIAPQQQSITRPTQPVLPPPAPITAAPPPQYHALPQDPTRPAPTLVS
jgi:hypothetical protein